MRRLAAAVGVPILVLGAVLVTNTIRFRSRQVAVEPAPAIPVDADAVARRLATALRFRTVSHQEASELDPAAFVGLHGHLEQSFPRVHASLVREVIERLSLLFTWKGRDATLPPLLLLAHLDVVPVDPTTDGAWSHPPFDGAIADGFVWGRGAMDDKASVLGILEAVERLLAEGFEPRRTVLLAFGHDEEIGGTEGAVRIAALLRERAISPAFVVDEGLAVTEGIVSGVRSPVALIGIAEKGYLSVELAVDAEGGHSSTPPRETAVGILAAAIERVEHHPRPARIAGPARRLFEFLGPEMPFTSRLGLANLWLLGPVVAWQLADSPATDALIRTTTAPTMLEASVKENVLPVRARAIVNFRIVTGETAEDVLGHVRAAVADPRVAIAPYGKTRSEPSRESSVDSIGFQVLERTIRQVFPESIVAPSLVLGATDSRHYADLGADVYRFLPLRVGPEDLRRAHGIDERIAVRDYADALRFYVQLIRNAD